MRSPIVKRSVVIGGRNTSVSLEDEFWQALQTIAAIRRMTLASLLGEIEHGRQQANLSSHIRLFVLNHYRAQRAAPAESALPC